MFKIPIEKIEDIDNRIYVYSLKTKSFINYMKQNPESVLDKWQKISEKTDAVWKLFRKNRDKSKLKQEEIINELLLSQKSLSEINIDIQNTNCETEFETEKTKLIIESTKIIKELENIIKEKL